MNKQELQEQAKLILWGKSKADAVDTLAYQNKRKKFLDLLSLLKDEGGIEVSTMYRRGDESISTKSQFYNLFNKYWNTFKTIPSMIVIELESEVSMNYCWKGIIDTTYALMGANKHFCIFHSKGSKSYYLIILDFYELNNYTPLQRSKIRQNFINHFVPFQYLHLIDKGFYHEHKMPLPFSVHWKYGTTFDLLFEHCPTGITIKPEPKKVYSKRKVAVTAVVIEKCEEHKIQKYNATNEEKLCIICVYENKEVEDATA